jgi:hypothetical protein
LESLNDKIDSLSSALKNQLSFNTMIETQLAQFVALVSSAEDGKISEQLVSSCENVCGVSTRWGPSRRARAANYAGRPIKQVLDPWESSTIVHKKDPGYPDITCTIYYHRIRNALCDLGMSVNLMSKAMFERLGYPALTPTSSIVQLVDASIQYPEGIVESLLVFFQGSCIFADFVGFFLGWALEFGLRRKC